MININSVEFNKLKNRGVTFPIIATYSGDQVLSEIQSLYEKMVDKTKEYIENGEVSQNIEEGKKNGKT